MKKQKYKPYFFDYKYEWRTYKYIGRDYGDSVTANKGLSGNFMRWFRKRIYNRRESKYKICNTYEEWECYVKSKLPMKIDYKNYMHWLIEQKQSADIELETVKAILIPIYIALLSMKEVFFFNRTPDLGAILIFIIVVIIFSVYILWKEKEILDFWNDLIKIVNSVI